ncbi:fatty acid desaturase [Pseudoruegeria sp. SHC-113]|uniref:fatty acid desaturase n=1 Tax=Pseudoruegeria sp. SHC-113 TaxID=2855439 RepID=UPI0021BA3D94|nr:fatty acid desaturase [Pseudoruegeria sp. SHC-113]MCT8159577.1 fatty acid desaturase [Pseudoruegeria sp. SHC-113]
MRERGGKGGVEWITLATLAGCYGAWALAIFCLADLSPLAAGLLAALAIALHSSLQHEALHGHPFRNATANAALVFPALGLFIPYARFRDTHLAHHRDAALTDPYDDPESYYLAPESWGRLCAIRRGLYTFNNTLFGRMLIGPALGQACFLITEVRAFRAGAPGIARAWGLHALSVALVLWAVSFSALPLWAYALAAYGGMSILKIRTFLEHQAHERARARTVIIEDRGPLAFLFLNNNLHVVHHMHPRVAWYRLPGLYRKHRAHYLRVNDGYRYNSYTEVLRRYAFRRKDPVIHPLIAHPGE